MKYDLEELASIDDRLEAIIEHILLLELRYTDEINAVHPSCRKSATNLVHYLGLRGFDIASLQKRKSKIAKLRQWIVSLKYSY